MRLLAGLSVVLLGGAMLVGCADLERPAFSDSFMTTREVQATLKAFIAQANLDAADTDDVIYISEASFDRIAFYVPLHTPVDLLGPEPDREAARSQEGPYPSSLPPGSARHKAWSEEVILAQQASSRFRLIEVTPTWQSFGGDLVALGLLERTVRKREAAVRIGGRIPAAPDGYRLWEAEFVLESRLVSSPMARFDFPTFRCAGQPYGDGDSSFENPPARLARAVGELENRPFDQERKVFSLTATYSASTGKWAIRSSRPDETIPLLTAPDWSAGLSVDERKSIFPPQVLDLIPKP